MLLITYDFTDNRTRTKFSKFLQKYGRRVQLSVFEIKNSDRVLNKILLEIEKVYKKKFTLADSILIWSISEADQKKIIRYGYAVHEDEEVVVFS